MERAANRQVDIAPVALATADASGRPAVRMVLLRGVDGRGFVFHTNQTGAPPRPRLGANEYKVRVSSRITGYTSRKARELAENPRAALCIHWPTLEEQIRVEEPSSG